jgi:hypothetical protein
MPRSPVAPPGDANDPIRTCTRTLVILTFSKRFRDLARIINE